MKDGIDLGLLLLGPATTSCPFPRGVVRVERCMARFYEWYVPYPRQIFEIAPRWCNTEHDERVLSNS
ncbi:MAG: hypothetical protein GYA24_20455 [Candidatus Lokiarchaeota archaeon]|nr:hypothetical protein [Candidatus Lokiarchaeota archaeon]